MGYEGGALAGLITSLTILVLALVVGRLLAADVTPAARGGILWTAIALCGVALAGGLIVGGAEGSDLSRVLGTAAVVLGALTLVGGVLLTDRALRDRQPDEPEP
jgi:H+-translocating NAD(P) transhydrogenase subunit alpha